MKTCLAQHNRDQSRWDYETLKEEKYLPLANPLKVREATTIELFLTEGYFFKSYLLY